MKFKVGDRVGLYDDIYTNRAANPWYSKTGIIGTLLSKWDWVSVEWDNGQENNYEPHQLFIVDEDPIIDVDELFEEIDI